MRRSSSDLAPRPRLAGREPIGSRPISVSGVTIENHGAKPSVFNRSRKRLRGFVELSGHSAYFSVISVFVFSTLGADCSSVAAATDSTWRMASTGLP